jgi:hypothetical protein
LEVNFDKSEVYATGELDAPILSRISDNNLQVKFDGLKLLGAPIGSDEFVKVSRKRSK